MAKVFISYHRQNRAIAKELAGDIETLGHVAWIDEELSGGQVWWDRILATVRECDVFVFVLEPKAMNSTACEREYGYAADLGKPILPVLVSEEMSTSLLPPALSQIQFVDYRNRDRAAALRLARAFTTVPPPKPLPDPLPTAPAVPLSYLGSVTERIASAPSLSYEEQSALLLDLKRSLRDLETNDDGRTLLKRLRKRRDLFATIADEIDELLGTTEKPSPAPSLYSAPAPPQPPSVLADERPPAALRRRPSGTIPLKARLSVASCGAILGTLFVALSILFSGAASLENDLNSLSLAFGAVPWAIAGAIAGTRRRSITAALGAAFAGLAGGWVIAAAEGHSDAVMYGVAYGALPGVILGAIFGVIWERMNRRS